MHPATAGPWAPVIPRAPSLFPPERIQPTARKRQSPPTTARISGITTSPETGTFTTLRAIIL